MKSKLRQKHKLECDILIAGGGIAGVCTALAVARCGSRVILCQDRPVLGGNASSEIRMHICGADVSGCRSRELEVEARETGIIEEIRLENAARNPQKSWSMMDLILYEKCIAEENLTLMLNTSVIAAEVSNNIIKKAKAVRESTEDEFEIKAKIFVDCTGDGRLGAEAGALFRTGTESSQQFKETRAGERADNKSLGSSLLFEAKDMGRPVPFIPPAWIRKFSEEELKLRDHHTFNYGYWWIEWGGCLDTIKDNEKIKYELLRILFGVWDHIKNSDNHNADDYALDWFGFLPGKRESRRFIGLHTFTENDAVSAPYFEDTIAYGGWPIDTHPPEGIDAPEQAPCAQPVPPHLYGIPLRCCISKNIKNLMFAGRNISATHIGFAALRVMATCGVIGQGVGTAAAYAVKRNILPLEILADQETVKCIQLRLTEDDCFLPGIEIEDKNVVLPDRIAASSQQAEAEANNVNSSLNRAVFGEGGLNPRYEAGGVNRWMSEPGQGLPAWIEFCWDKPVTINQISLVFDSGLHRPLALTKDRSSETMNKTMLWRVPPELVSNYTVKYQHDSGKWIDIFCARDNYQRLRIHRFEKIKLHKIRVVVSKTNSLNHARICSIRCLNY